MRDIRLTASNAVQAAIKEGRLINLSDVHVVCVDCGKRRATCYDHRDYNKPLEVVAVCHGCNVRRGPATGPAPQPRRRPTERPTGAVGITVRLSSRIFMRVRVAGRKVNLKPGPMLAKIAELYFAAKETNAAEPAPTEGVPIKLERG